MDYIFRFLEFDVLSCLCCSDFGNQHPAPNRNKYKRIRIVKGKKKSCRNFKHKAECEQKSAKSKCCDEPTKKNSRKNSSIKIKIECKQEENECEDDDEEYEDDDECEDDEEECENDDDECDDDDEDEEECEDDDDECDDDEDECKKGKSACAEYEDEEDDECDDDEDEENKIKLKVEYFDNCDDFDQPMDCNDDANNEMDCCNYADVNSKFKCEKTCNKDNADKKYKQAFKKSNSKTKTQCALQKKQEEKCLEFVTSKIWQTLVADNDDSCTKGVSWRNLSANQKLLVYWGAVNKEILSESPFTNFKRLHFSMVKKGSDQQRLATAKCAWTCMTPRQKLPFIMEAFICNLSLGKVHIENELEIKNEIASLQIKANEEAE